MVESESKHERRNDVIVPRIEQKLDDLIIEVRRHVEWGESVVASHDKRIGVMEKLLDRIEWPAKAIGWFVVTILTGSVIWVGEKIGAWVMKHFQ
jgi:hypothetical protein